MTRRENHDWDGKTGRVSGNSKSHIFISCSPNMTFDIKTLSKHPYGAAENGQVPCSIYTGAQSLPHRPFKLDAHGGLYLAVSSASGDVVCLDIVMQTINNESLSNDKILSALDIDGVWSLLNSRVTVLHLRASCGSQAIYYWI